uniref:NSFL1 (p97) cofactor (p47) n=1 Tax=Neogobius melanostomus TaxID=47308 RepID=A0A8C6SPF1_9GOBI
NCPVCPVCLLHVRVSLYCGVFLCTGVCGRRLSSGGGAGGGVCVRVRRETTAQSTGRPCGPEAVEERLQSGQWRTEELQRPWEHQLPGGHTERCDPGAGTCSRLSVGPAAAEADAGAAVSLDTSAPVTNIQIRLADGGRLVQRFNHTHRVSDLRSFVVAARPVMAAQEFVLMTTFPNKELSDESQTLQQANLLNAVIVQRLK